MAVILLAENSYICVLGWITGVICNAWYGWWQNRTQTIIAKTHIYREISTTREKGRWERKRGIKQAWYHVELNWHWWWTENMGANEAKRAFSSVVCWLAPPFFYNLRCSLQEELFSFASDVSNAWYGMEWNLKLSHTFLISSSVGESNSQRDLFNFAIYALYGGEKWLGFGFAICFQGGALFSIVVCDNDCGNGILWLLGYVWCQILKLFIDRGR